MQIFIVILSAAKPVFLLIISSICALSVSESSDTLITASTLVSDTVTTDESKPLADNKSSIAVSLSALFSSFASCSTAAFLASSAIPESSAMLFRFSMLEALTCSLFNLAAATASDLTPADVSITVPGSSVKVLSFSHNKIN